jgi:hypothetical protein
LANGTESVVGIRIYLDEDGVVGRHGDVGEVRPDAHPGGGEGGGEEHVDEEVQLRVPHAQLLEHLPQVQQRAGHLRHEHAGHHLRPALRAHANGNNAASLVRFVVGWLVWLVGIG